MAGITRKSDPAASSAAGMPPTALWSLMATPARPVALARATSSAGTTRESGEYRVWLCRSNRMEKFAERAVSLKDLGDGIPDEGLSSDAVIGKRDGRLADGVRSRPHPGGAERVWGTTRSAGLAACRRSAGQWRAGSLRQIAGADIL